MSIYPPTTAIHTKNGKKGERVQCFGCEEILEESHAGQLKNYLLNYVFLKLLFLGIQCAQSHHLCMDCSANLVALFVAEPNINLPPRCMVC